MSHRALAGLIVALVASSGQSPVQPSALAEAAPPAAAAVEILVSASTGTQTSEGWCIDSAPSVTLTAQVIKVADQSEVTEGTIVWQVCQHNSEALPYADCDGRGPGRWTNAAMSFLSADPTPSITTFQVPLVRGWRLQFHPVRGSGLGSATFDSFNLDRTCS